MSMNLENIMFFNDGMCRYKSYGSNERETVRLLASIEVSDTKDTKRSYTVMALKDEIRAGGPRDDERVVLHTKTILPAYEGAHVLGVVASVWSKKDGHEGKLMVIGPVTAITFAEANDLKFSDRSYWHAPRHSH